MQNINYRLANGDIWNTEKARYLEDPEKENLEDFGGRLIDLINSNGQSDEAYLIRTLECYNLPLGCLVTKSAAAIRRELARLDEVYLTPRVLAGLAHGSDPVAQAYWYAHERKAEPLRLLLTELTGESPEPLANPDEEDNSQGNSQGNSQTEEGGK